MSQLTHNTMTESPKRIRSLYQRFNPQPQQKAKTRATFANKLDQKNFLLADKYIALFEKLSNYMDHEEDPDVRREAIKGLVKLIDTGLLYTEAKATPELHATQINVDTQRQEVQVNHQKPAQIATDLLRKLFSDPFCDLDAIRKEVLSGSSDDTTTDDATGKGSTSRGVIEVKTLGSKD